VLVGAHNHFARALRFVPPPAPSNTLLSIPWGRLLHQVNALTAMGKHSLEHRVAALDRPPTPAATHVPHPLKPPIPSPRASHRLFEHALTCPDIEAILRTSFTDPPRKQLRKMPKSSTLSLAMRGKSKENANTPMSPKSPKSPGYFNGAELASPNAPFRNAPESPASPKLRKDSKSIFSNFSANKSSSRIINQDSTIRQIPEQQPSPVYSNGRGGTSTPDLSRPVQTPNSDGGYQGIQVPRAVLTYADNRSEILRLDHRTNSGLSNEPLEPTDPSKRNTIKPKKQSGMLSRTRSIKGDENSGSRMKLNKAPPPQLSPDIAGTWTTNGDGTSLKTAPLEKGQSWRSLVGQGKMRTHSADRHDSNHRDEDHRRDRVEQGSLASSSYNESKGATFMSSIGSGARKVGDKMDSARKGIFGKLGRSSSNHETPTLVTTNEPYVCKTIHKPLIEQTRLTRISSRLEQSRDKTEFWMPALPWRCIE